MTSEYSYARYLDAKQSVDNRALNRSVLEQLRKVLPSSPRQRPLRVLELGGATGSMVRRVLDWQLLTECEYHLVDQSRQSLDLLPDSLEAWLNDHEGALRATSEGFQLERSLQTLQLTIEHADIYEFLRTSEVQYDLVIAHAVLDLLHLDTLLPLLWKRASGKALFWFTLNFDGESTFLPKQQGDSEIWEAYHASMDARSGTRHCGQALFTALQRSGAKLLQAGSSDWVVHAIDGHYPAQEAYFLQHILHTVDQELHKEGTRPLPELARWLATRKQQIATQELVYLARQFDFIGTVSCSALTP